MAFVPPPYFDTVFWSERDGDQDDPEAPLLPIRPGELQAVQTALLRIWKQFEGTDSWPLLFTLLGDLWAGLELGLGSVDQARYLSTAEGVQLDKLGELIGRSRNGVSDDLYREVIQADAGTLFTSGTTPEIVALVMSLFGPATRVQDFYPAAVLIQSPNIDPEVFALMLDVLRDATSAGVALILSTYDRNSAGGVPASTRVGVAALENQPGRFGSTRGGTSDDLAWHATGRGVAAGGAP